MTGDRRVHCALAVEAALGEMGANPVIFPTATPGARRSFAPARADPPQAEPNHTGSARRSAAWRSRP